MRHLDLLPHFPTTDFSFIPKTCGARIGRPLGKFTLLAIALLLVATGCDDGQTTANPLPDAGTDVLDTTGTPEDGTTPDVAVDGTLDATLDGTLADTLLADTNVADLVTDGTTADTANPPADVQPDIPVTGSPIGGPCNTDADCADADGQCLTAPEFPNGYCRAGENCTTSPDNCPTGTECTPFTNGNNWCLLLCNTTSDCRSGYICDSWSQCWPGCEPGGCPAGQVCSSSSECVPDPNQTGVVGGPCATDADCGTGGQCLTAANGFPGGLCRGHQGCTESPDNCAAGQQCTPFTDNTTWCMDTCNTAADCRTGYACDSSWNECWPGCTAGSCATGEVCNTTTNECETAPCTANSCPTGQICSNQRCVLDIGTPPTGTHPVCTNLPPINCTGTAAYCGEIVPFDPDLGTGYWDYPINGETTSNQYRSYVRRDLMLLIKYAAAKVDCLAVGWPGNGGAVALGDMSEADGAIPGTSVGSPGHPAGTHVNGYDMDIGYFQVNTANNQLRPICDHMIGNVDQYHCTSTPYLLDVWRSALFAASLHDAVVGNQLQLRVMGVDGQAGVLFESAIDQLCAAGWYTGNACNASYRSLAYEVTDTGRGWYQFHHHHMHVSINGLTAGTSPMLYDNKCLTPGCQLIDPAQDLRWTLYPSPEREKRALPDRL